MPQLPSQQEEKMEQENAQQPFAHIYARSQPAYQRASPRREVHFDRSAQYAMQERHSQGDKAALDDIMSWRQQQEEQLARWSAPRDVEWVVRVHMMQLAHNTYSHRVMVQEGH